jgi:hypothetical protein
VPRELVFTAGDTQFSCGLNKVDRTKLYGSVDIETIDADGNRCSLATLANDGKTLISTGGTGFGYVTPDGKWIERADLIPMDLDGEALPTLPSSFDAPIELSAEADLSTFLDHSIRLCYVLDCERGFERALIEQLSGGTIFQFEFLYRAGVSPDPAFILADADDNVWMLVGTPAKIDFTGLDQGTAATAQADADESDEDDFDFDML